MHHRRKMRTIAAMVVVGGCHSVLLLLLVHHRHVCVCVGAVAFMTRFVFRRQLFLVDFEWKGPR